MNDLLHLGGKDFTSRLILGSGKFSLDLITAVIEEGGGEIITLALRRANPDGAEDILSHIPEGVTLLPNTSGARNAEEAVRIAELSRAMGCGNWVKVEVINDSRWLLPDNAETVRATKMLAERGFVVLPYMFPDLDTAKSAGRCRRRCCYAAGGTRSAPTAASCTKQRSPRSSQTLTFRLLSMPALANQARLLKPWRWVPTRSCATQPSQPLATFA